MFKILIQLCIKTLLSTVDVTSSRKACDNTSINCFARKSHFIMT